MIALDIETTGLDERKHCMVSLGAVHIESEKQFYGECRIYGDSVISEKALEKNGFTEEEIRDLEKPWPHELYNQFLDWVEGEHLLIGQNLPSFDVQFLKFYHYNILGNNRKWPFGHRYIDLHSYVYAKTGKSQSHDKTLEMLGLPKEPKPHHALTGAKIVKEIFEQYGLH